MKEYVKQNPQLETIAQKIIRNPRNVIKPGFAVKCVGTKVNGVEQYFVNVAHSTKLNQSPDFSDVGVIVSKIRECSKSDHGPYHVVDCVVHPSIFNKAEKEPAYRAQLIDCITTC